jgi:hypothetical protein
MYPDEAIAWRVAYGLVHLQRLAGCLAAERALEVLRDALGAGDAT